MDFKKSTNSFETKNLIIYWAIFICTINALDIFDIVDFLKIFFVSRNTDILPESNCWLGMYVP